MAVVQGVKEKVHLPIYDCLTVEPREQLRKSIQNNSTIKFFVDVQGKTKLETNLQSASLLPHYNTFEARAMRVVITDLPPEFPDEETIKLEELDVLDSSGATIPNVTATLESSVSRLMDLLAEAEESDDGTAEIPEDDEDVTISTPGSNRRVSVSARELEAAFDEELTGPPRLQQHPNNGAGTLIGNFVYNTVTTLFVGEKEMIRMPTWFFPAGAGPHSETGHFSTHGEPTPLATFRFAEPIFIDKQQNFRVEIEIPDQETFRQLQRTYGPLRVWVVIDGYMTRDVQ